MEVGSSAITGAMRVAVQVVVARKRPVLEIYQTLRNEFGPPEGPTDTKYRMQDIFVDLQLVNIGGDRAEKVTFAVSGDFKRASPREKMPERFSSTVHHFAPGQVMFLMKIEPNDLRIYTPDDPNTFRATGMKKETMKIIVHYDGPDTFVNKLLRLWPHFRGRKQYSTEFIFDPANVIGDLPAATYNG